MSIDIEKYVAVKNAESEERKFRAIDSHSGGYPYETNYFQGCQVLTEGAMLKEAPEILKEGYEIYKVELVKIPADRKGLIKKNALAKLTEEEKKVLGLA